MSLAGQARGRVVWVTSLGGVTDHAVRTEDLAVAVSHRGRGIRAVCGARFWPAPMVSDPGPTCSVCARHLRMQARLRSTGGRMAEQLRQTAVGRWLSARVSVRWSAAVRSGGVRSSPGSRGGAA